MPGSTAEERIPYLKSQAMIVETSTHYRPLEPDELQAAKDNFIQNAHKISTIKEEAKQVMQGYKDQIEALEEENAVYMQSALTKSAEVVEKIYGIDDQQRGTVSFYNENGDLISARRLKPEERQLRIADRGDDLKEANGF